jgi:hypothetical protein
MPYQILKGHIKHVDYHIAEFSRKERLEPSRYL